MGATVPPLPFKGNLSAHVGPRPAPSAAGIVQSGQVSASAAGAADQ